MAHEYTHLVIDEKTKGNYPRWFSEGLAQYVEQSLNYFTTQAPRDKTIMYSFEQLEDNFDQQVDQERAYWQSLQAVTYIIDTFGVEMIDEILVRLARGHRFETILLLLTGHTYESLEYAVFYNTLERIA